MINTYKFFETLEENNYKFTPNDLKYLAGSVGHDKDYYLQKLKNMGDKICKMGHADNYSICDRTEKCACWIRFDIGDGELDFYVDFYDSGIRIHYEYSVRGIDHNYIVGHISTNTFVHVLNLFKKYGKYADPNNPDIVTLLKKVEN